MVLPVGPAGNDLVDALFHEIADLEDLEASAILEEIALEAFADIRRTVVHSS